MVRFTTRSPPALGARRATFTDAAAVEAWDAWFRWRADGELHDLTIDDTWTRVSTALGAAERAGDAAAWVQRFADAFSSWRLLPDERVLAGAGTGRVEWPADGLVAVLNLAAFVRGGFTPAAQFDRGAFGSMAELAVRMVDDAALLACAERKPGGTARIGVIGLADALALLGMPYAGDDSLQFAADIARRLSESCLHASAHLAAERGGAPAGRGTDSYRFERHTAIAVQPRLAQFANNVTDALDPLSPDVHGADRSAMRAAFQAWIDEPIDYPTR